RSSRRYCARVISVQAILISSGYRKPMNHNPLKSLNSFSVRHSMVVNRDWAVTHMPVTISRLPIGSSFRPLLGFG
ncbi:hypothetical protein, partial [Komagataeibacter rhaeticus]|uniref:hypothetical protein n=1 Tax=Komagataeibacter rhaeticus TaxID=215221 RepID=UPI001CD6E744